MSRENPQVIPHEDEPGKLRRGIWLGSKPHRRSIAFDEKQCTDRIQKIQPGQEFDARPSEQAAFDDLIEWCQDEVEPDEFSARAQKKQGPGITDGPRKTQEARKTTRQKSGRRAKTVAR